MTEQATTGATDEQIEAEIRTERLAEWVFDALAGFFDFGEDGKDSEDDHRWDIARHVAARFNKHVNFVGSDECVIDAADVAGWQRVTALARAARLFYHFKGATVEEDDWIFQKFIDAKKAVTDADLVRIDRILAARTEGQG